MNDIKTLEVVEILPTDVWAEKDVWGQVHIKMQHQGHEVFDFIQIQYDWTHTSNSHQFDLTKKIGKLLGVEDIQFRTPQ